MTNNNGYKVIWLKNGDVLQYFKNDISTYFSKEKSIHKIIYKDLSPIFYHKKMQQIWRVL